MLPTVPSNVALLENVCDVNGYDVQYNHWLFVPAFDTAGPSYFDALLTAYILEVGGALLDCMHSGASFTTCRLSRFGSQPFTWIKQWPPNHGRWTGGQANNVAVGFYVRTTTGGRGSGSRCRIPACPDIFVTENRQLSQVGLGNLLALTEAIVAWAAGLTGPTAGDVLLGTLQRRTVAGPLPSATFSPAAALTPSQRVERLGRRLPRSGQVSPI